MKVLVHRLDRYGARKPGVSVYTSKQRPATMSKKLAIALLKEVVFTQEDFEDDGDRDYCIMNIIDEWTFQCSKSCAHISGEEEDIVITII